MYFLISLFLLIIVLVSVGFFTLMERKVLSYIQFRSGPNSVGYLGILQPFSDGVKLFLSEMCWPFNSNLMIYFVCPLLGLVQSLFIWVMFPFYLNCVDFIYGLMFFLCCSSVGIYSIMVCGWSSNSSYSVLGAIRSVSQAISYEVTLSLILLSFFLIMDSYSFVDFYSVQLYSWLAFLSLPLFFCWMSCCMAETNRTPFDFSEGESELVSGFNVEYGSGGFAILFISEYSSIIFMSMITCMIFMGCNFFSFFFYMKIVSVCFFFVWVRGTFPRYRYDKLMYLAWKCYLPLSLNYLYLIFLVKSMFIYHFFLLSY